MKRAVFFTVRAEARQLKRRIDRLLQYPRRGQRARAGVLDSRIPDTWDGTGPTPYGWTRSHTRIRKHPNRDEWAVRITQEVIDALSDARASRLAPAERSQMQAQLAASAEPDVTWDEAGDDNDE